MHSGTRGSRVRASIGVSALEMEEMKRKMGMGLWLIQHGGGLATRSILLLYPHMVRSYVNNDTINDKLEYRIYTMQYIDVIARIIPRSGLLVMMTVMMTGSTTTSQCPKYTPFEHVHISYFAILGISQLHEYMKSSF